MSRPNHQAEVSKAQAEANIIRKLNVLEGWLASGIPYQQTFEGNTLLDGQDQKLFDFYPTSLRQFKIWDGSQNCHSIRAQLPALVATGNDTLAKRPVLEERARRVISALRRRAESQTNGTQRFELKRITAELQVAQATIEIRNAELREQQRKLRQIERANATLNQKVAGDATEFKRTYEVMLTELETQKLLNTQLTAQLNKVSPLRRVDTE